MKSLLCNGHVWHDGQFQPLDVAIADGQIISIGSSLPKEGFSVIDITGFHLVPGFVDVHVHLREPGFSYKETIATGTAASARGGYTGLGAMPNLKPVPDCMDSLQVQLDIIEKDAAVRVYPYGAITVGQKGETLADLTAMAPFVLGYTDDGRGVQNTAMMEEAMTIAKTAGKPIVAHCEDESLLEGCITVHPGNFAKAHGFEGACAESEWGQIARDLELVEKTGCQYHICHLSCKESVEVIRQAKAKGLPVTCETGPHYLIMTDDDIKNEGRYKMNPPIRGTADRDALVAGLVDGTIDCIATDHAPHSHDEKCGDFTNSFNGVVGIETAFATVYTYLVETGKVPMKTVVDALTVNPCRIFGLEGGTIAEGAVADLTVLNLTAPYTIYGENGISMGKATPFEGWDVNADIAMTICGGKIVYNKEDKA
ncbi:dihydroorotase [Bengtsoniella intestinalis]|uniref:dihydroorotase n=1 Tax=Bengtsoniella intestinalis TaxID=3073143 RepID=UPI00391FC3F0